MNEFKIFPFGSLFTWSMQDASGQGWSGPASQFVSGKLYKRISIVIQMQEYFCFFEEE